VVDKPCTKEYVELARGLLKSAEATFEVIHLGRAISESEGLADVHVLHDWGVEERNVDVKLTQFKVAGGRDGKEEAKTGHADD
jgi:Co/Zn/Cd efflux system component